MNRRRRKSYKMFIRSLWYIWKAGNNILQEGTDSSYVMSEAIEVGTPITCLTIKRLHYFNEKKKWIC